MANKVVQLVDKNSNNLYPIAGSVITDAVSTTAISNQAVTNPKIENGAVNGVANDATAIGTAKLALDTVGTPNLRDESVTSDKIDFTTFRSVLTSSEMSIAVPKGKWVVICSVSAFQSDNALGKWSARVAIPQMGIFRLVAGHRFGSSLDTQVDWHDVVLFGALDATSDMTLEVVLEQTNQAYIGRPQWMVVPVAN